MLSYFPFFILMISFFMYPEMTSVKREEMIGESQEELSDLFQTQFFLTPRHFFSHKTFFFNLNLQNLDCGSRYHVFLISKNIVGTSPPSKTAVARTLGGPPLYASHDKFVVANSTEASVYTRTWTPQGCPITHFSVEYRKDSQLHWVQGQSRIRSTLGQV